MKYFTIILATYNAEKYLENLFESIVPQKSDEVELIVLDGGSKDSTVEIINRYKGIVNYWVSEPDGGIYDAWNKGIKASSGRWIMFLGADDALGIGALARYKEFIESLNDSNLDYISSKVQMVDSNSKPIWVGGDPWSWPAFQYRMTVAHPGSLHSRLLFEKVGLFNTSYKITGDYELLLRLGDHLKTAYFNDITVFMREGGVSDSWKAIKETTKAIVKTGKANIISAHLVGLYVYCKSRLNKAGRKVGLNLNKRR